MKRGILISIGSLCVASLLWFTVSMSKVYQYPFTVPVVFTDVPANRALRTQLPSAVEVVLRGTGWKLLFLRFGKSLRYEIRLNEIRSGTYLLTGRNARAAMNLTEDVDAVAVAPETLAIAFDSQQMKRVPLVAAYALTCASGYGQTAPASLVPDSVTISGAESVLRLISEWRTHLSTFSDASSDVSATVPVSDTLASIVRVSPSRAALTIPVQQLVDVEFKSIPIAIEHVPQGKQVMLSASTVNIIARGGIDRMANLTSDQFSASIEFASLLRDTVNAVTPQIKLPEGVTLLRLSPEQIRFTIRQ